MDGASYIQTDLSGAIALVIGGEGSGVSRLVKETCDFCVSIPMKGGVNSLNASNAAAILMYEVLRSRSDGARLTRQGKCAAGKTAGRITECVSECQEARVADKNWDDKMVKLAREGDDSAAEALLQKYKTVVKRRASSYYMAGADRDDVIQEGMIGVFKAIRDYDPEKGASFSTFADLCINRQIGHRGEKRAALQTFALKQFDVSEQSLL